VRAGETVRDHRAVDLFVIERLDVAAAQELEDRGADADPVAGAQRELLVGRQRVVVQRSAVGRTEVGDEDRAVALAQPAMTSRDRVDRHHHFALVLATDDHLVAVERPAPAEVRSVDRNQTGLAARRRDDLRIGERDFGCIAIDRHGNRRHVSDARHRD
jgi:hypothetical protein